MILEFRDSNPGWDVPAGMERLSPGSPEIPFPIFPQSQIPARLPGEEHHLLTSLPAFPGFGIQGGLGAALPAGGCVSLPDFWESAEPRGRSRSAPGTGTSLSSRELQKSLSIPA